ncbi:putative reverse transcriptase domain-containing protein [Tanacetum coccineum]
MFDFDVILGMDWLASHRATIDCYARTVIFGNVRQPEFVYHGSSPLKSVKLIYSYVRHTLICSCVPRFSLPSVLDTSLEKRLNLAIELSSGLNPISRLRIGWHLLEVKGVKGHYREVG